MNSLTSLVKHSLYRATQQVSKHSPEFLAGIAIAGVVTTTALAVRATPKAMELLEQNPPKKAKKHPKINYAKDVVLTCWKVYIPTAISGAITIASIIASNRVSAKRMAVLASLYSVSEKALNEYKATVKEELGQKAADKVSGAVAKKEMERATVPPEEDIIATGQGSSLCFDTMSARYFLSSAEALRRAENELNSYILRNAHASLNDFYDIIGLEHCELGEDVGWRLDNMLTLHFESKLTDEEKPCLIVGYTVKPGFAYDSVW